MTLKNLTTKDWQKFAAGGDYKDAAVLKALRALEKAERAPAGERLGLLDELDTAGRDLAKNHKGDKKLLGFLDEMGKAVKLARKAAEEEQASERDEEQDEEEKGSALLDPKRLLSQLNLCKKDPERTVQFAYVDGKDKAPGVVAFSPRVAGRRLFALLTQEIGVKTGAYGSAWVDGTELMLQLDKPLSGLVKKMRAPIKACGFRAAKIVLWNADGTVFEQDASEDGETTTDQPLPPTAPPNDARTLAFSARLKALLPAIAASASTKEGQAAKLLAAEAGAQVREGNFDAGNQSLDKVDKLLARLKDNASGSPDAGTARPGVSLVALGRARLAWRSERLHARVELKRLQAELAVVFKDDQEQSQALAEALQRLDGLIERFVPDLDDRLDDVLNAAADTRPALIKQARDMLDNFTHLLETDEVLAEIDGNELLPDMAVAAPLRSALGAISAALG